MSGIESDIWGAGARVVLVHGSLATGPVEWEAQRPLVDEGYQLVVPTRRAYTPQSGSVGEDYRVDGEDVAALLGDGAHLVGHSYGGLVAMVAAAARPEAVHSLVLAEAPVFSVAADHPDVARLREQVEQVLAREGSDREFLEDFLRAVGTPLEELPPDLLDDLTDLVPAVRLGRRPWSGPVPVDGLVGAPFPTVVVSGNHHPAFTAMCDALARELGAQHCVVEGAGHEMQMVAEDFNAVLLSLWRGTGAGSD
ncbi:alpha/beta fold hydrolase [Nocardioides sp.]|uniref:alpha/beta fold hydrolase n=1 Tax=Nocardioides sp. TaxID=35761 RepID=UPI0027362A45|nr:alpha/beta hydrolase [Nocardioides sp.]MDP3893454.1 alpha/beta hydrolase [Nocardioides sp.]